LILSDVFISYSRDDLENVTRIAEAIQRAGYDLWWDADLPPHRSYGDVIQEKIGGAKAVVVVWSEDATKSEWVRAEADMARNQRKLIQTSIDDGMPPLPFNQIQYASLTNWDGDSDHPAWRKVLVSLSDLVGAAPEAAATTVSTGQKTTPPPAPAQSEAKSSHIPLIISLVSLIAVIGLLAWLVLGGEDEAAVPADTDNANIVEPTEPVPPAPVPESQSTAPTPEPKNTNEFNESAVIEDDDGWTNFRAAPSRSSSILGRLESGEVFFTHKQPGEWWKIRTEDGVIGYMHYSRISLTINRPKKAKVLFPDSGQRLISPAELSTLSKADLRLARNEIFARRGRIFESADLRAHFSSFDWYRPTTAEVEVNDFEKANAKAMQAEEQRR